MRSRSLGFEALESRRLLAVAEFHFQLLKDQNGLPGGPIAADAVRAGETFFLEVIAEDVQSRPVGLHGISLDIQWDPSVFALADPFEISDVVTDKLPLFAFGTHDEEIGRINDLTGMSGFGAGEPIGQQGPERFALLHFTALEPVIEGSEFKMRGGMYGIGFSPPVWTTPVDFQFEPYSITVFDPVVITPPEAAATGGDPTSGPTPATAPSTAPAPAHLESVSVVFETVAGLVPVPASDPVSDPVSDRSSPTGESGSAGRATDPAELAPAVSTPVALQVPLPVNLLGPVTDGTEDSVETTDPEPVRIADLVLEFPRQDAQGENAQGEDAALAIYGPLQHWLAAEADPAGPAEVTIRWSDLTNLIQALAEEIHRSRRECGTLAAQPDNEWGPPS